MRGIAASMRALSTPVRSAIDLDEQDPSVNHRNNEGEREGGKQPVNPVRGARKHHRTGYQRGQGCDFDHERRQSWNFSCKPMLPSVRSGCQRGWWPATRYCPPPRIANAAVRIECWGASSSEDVTRTESRRASDEAARRIRCGDFMSSVRLIEMPKK
jgi:hypothetical protein